jgi:PPOX class probable F420-dependent enzyme
VNDAGLPDLVPITFALLAPDVLVTAVDHKPKTTTALARLDNITREPKVTLLVDHYEDDWSALWWVRLRGVATVLDASTPRHDEVVGALAAKYPEYAERPPTGPAIVVDIDEWRWWAARPS